MKRPILQILYKASLILESVAGVYLAGCLILALVGSVLQTDVHGLLQNSELISDYIAKIATIVLGLEFIKMLFRHSMSAVLEVVLVALARQMIVSHSTALENLLSVLAIALLFGVQKYLSTSNPSDPASGDGRTN